MFITDVAGDVSLRLFCSLGFSRSVVDGLVASSGADRNGNYRPEPDTLLLLLIAKLPVNTDHNSLCSWGSLMWLWAWLKALLSCPALHFLHSAGAVMKENIDCSKKTDKSLVHLWKRISEWVRSHVLPLQSTSTLHEYIKWKMALHYVYCRVLPEHHSRQLWDWIITFHSQQGSQIRGKYE